SRGAVARAASGSGIAYDVRAVLLDAGKRPISAAQRRKVIAGAVTEDGGELPITKNGMSDTIAELRAAGHQGRINDVAHVKRTIAGIGGKVVGIGDQAAAGKFSGKLPQI